MTDQELFAKAREGDQAAIAEVLSRNKGLVNKIARSYYLVGGDLEDLIQEGMIGLYRAIKNYDPSRNNKFSTLAYICIRHQIQASVKKANSHNNQVLSKAYPILDQSDDEDAEIVLPSDLPTPDNQLMLQETIKEKVDKINSVLSPHEQEIFNLYMQGYNNSDMAKLSGRPRKSIDNALTRIRSKVASLKKAE